MCDGSSNREKRDDREEDVTKFKPNSSFIAKKSVFRFIKGHPREEYVPSWPKLHRCVYPKVNAYYAFHEDANPFARFTAKCESREDGNVRPHFEPPEQPHVVRDPYCEIEARQTYLETPPTCFAIFGKPGLDTTELATKISEFWNCVLISPSRLVQLEIERGTEKGKIMVDVLKTGECLGPDVVTNLVENRIGERDVFHRGYVVEGLPLIPNELLDYSSYPSRSNEDDRDHARNYAKLFGTEFPRVCGTTTDLGENHRDVLSNNAQWTTISRDLENKRCTVEPDYERFIFSQVDEIFTRWPIKPSIVIYAMCPDTDVARKRERSRIDTVTGLTVDTSLGEMSRDVETLDPDDWIEKNFAFEFHREAEEEIWDGHRRKYLLKRPSDRRSNVEAQCNLYKRFAMPVIERWILSNKPQNLIRVDGRASVSRTIQVTIARLRTLPIPRMILPKRFTDPVRTKYSDESPVTPSPVYDFENKSNEEAFQYLTNRDTILPVYPWRLSSWKFLCPVELTRGRTVEGMSKHAVRFMNKVFFLSSVEATELFLENPRTFLIPFAPRPTCKIAVFGPKYSGKSYLCEKLAQIFGGTIVNGDTDSVSFFDTSIRTKDTNVVVKKIRDISREEIDTGVWRDGGYVLDGMYPDIDDWRTIVEEQDIVFEDVVLLFDEDPYEYLTSKWCSIHSNEKKSRESLEDEYTEDTDDDEEKEPRGLLEYLRQIRQFELDWEEARETIADSCKNLIACNLGNVDNVYEYVVESVRDRYTDKARIMSDEEKELEKDFAEYMTVSDNTRNVGENEADDEERINSDVKEDNLRFGDTNYYCPIALLKHNVFRRGKEDFSAIFMDKIYRLSNATALEEFVRDPRILTLPLRKPLSTIPPLRVSIVGPSGSGKSTLANAISREYGLVHVDYLDRFAMFAKARAMSPFSRKDSLISPEDFSEEVELPEDLTDEKYNSDEATVRTFVQRYWRSGGVLPEKMLRDCLTKFFDGLYNLFGIVLDGFPSCPQDVETALKNYTVPEIVIELTCGRYVAHERTMPELAKLWRDTLEEKKSIESTRHEEALDRYEADEEAWIDEMLREMIADLRARESEEFSWSSRESDGERDETFAEIINRKRLELEEAWQNENPIPVLFTDWEDYETAKPRIEREFEKVYENDLDTVSATRSALENELIPYTMVDGERSPKEVLLRVMRILGPYVNRDVSVLEKAYAIDPETAEVLLACGYYLRSSYGQWCPVQLHENKIPLQMFLPLEAEQDVHPVIHRQFIYFLGGEDARSAFLKNPLKYLEQDSCAPVVPFRLAVIGPPKCGKTTLARRFAKQYGVKVVTRGAALRHVLQHFPWTESAEFAESRLRAGQLAPEESLSRAVETYSIDPRSISQGIVLDGFPANRKEYEELTFLGIQPIIVLDLKASLEFCSDCLSQGDDETKRPTNFSVGFLARRYASWNLEQGSFRDWLGKFAQNVIELDATRSTWHVWTRADREVCSRYKLIGSYYRESDYDKCHSLRFMNVSPYEFKQRQSRYESYCPLCLFHENVTNASGPPPDHEGLVQFREHFYWICPRHMNDFVRNPEKHLPPINTASLPEDRPRILTETIDLEHACWARRLRVGGYCLVTYVDNLPSRKLVPGNSSIGVLHEDMVYLFCTEECRDKFLARSAKYASVEVQFLRTLPPIDVKDLPDLGYLEQTVAKTIVEVVNQVSVIRPKLPGLSPAATAAIYIGVFLKTRNVTCALRESGIYDTACQRMLDREKILKVATRVMKKKLNPFVTIPASDDYDDHDDLFRISRHLSLTSDLYQRFIKFRRTSPTQLLFDASEDESDD